jgi:hypothetical protein
MILNLCININDHLITKLVNAKLFKIPETQPQNAKIKNKPNETTTSVY